MTFKMKGHLRDNSDIIESSLFLNCVESNIIEQNYRSNISLLTIDCRISTRKKLRTTDHQVQREKRESGTLCLGLSIRFESRSRPLLTVSKRFQTLRQRNKFN